jgi:hypothetical protein
VFWFLAVLALMMTSVEMPNGKLFGICLIVNVNSIHFILLQKPKGSKHTALGPILR